jgi:hypothetical protein
MEHCDGAQDYSPAHSEAHSKHRGKTVRTEKTELKELLLQGSNPNKTGFWNETSAVLYGRKQ